MVTDNILLVTVEFLDKVCQGRTKDVSDNEQTEMDNINPYDDIKYTVWLYIIIELI